MILKLLLFVFLPLQLLGSINILSPLDGEVSQHSTINFKFNGSDSKGFLMVQDQIVPIRKTVQTLPLSLNLGENKIKIYILDEDRKIQFDVLTSINIFRSLYIDDLVTFNERYLLTELTRQFNLSLVNNNKAKMEFPVLKKDLYAFLMWFYLDQPKSSLSLNYIDMDVYSNYLNLYEFQEVILPEPRLGNFYPDSFVTVQEVLQLIMKLEGKYQLLNDENIISESFNPPNNLKSIIPLHWKDQVQLVSRRDVIDVLFKYFDQSIRRDTRKVVINWPRTVLPKIDPPDLSKSVSEFRRVIQELSQRINRSSLDKGSQLKMVKKNSNQYLKLSLDREKVLDNISNTVQVIEVRKGDSLPKISKQFLGSSKYWLEIAKINDLKVENVTINQKVVSKVEIFPGQKLKMPKI